MALRRASVMDDFSLIAFSFSCRTGKTELKLPIHLFCHVCEQCNTELQTYFLP